MAGSYLLLNIFKFWWKLINLTWSWLLFADLVMACMLRRPGATGIDEDLGLRYIDILFIYFMDSRIFVVL